MDVQKIASYISRCYQYQFGSRIEEVKLHILLYFCQREYMVEMGETMFDETFCAKSFGPYLPMIHSLYQENALHETLSKIDANTCKPVLDKVLGQLMAKKTRSLCDLVRGEYSWKKAVAQGEGTPLHVEDIAKDAERFGVRCFLLNNLDKFCKPVYA